MLDILVTALLTAPTHHTTTLKPCKYEDSPGPCYWNARKRGNHKGRSFIVTKSGKVYYVKGL